MFGKPLLIKLTGRSRRQRDWQLEAGPVAGTTEMLTFIPYSCTKLHVVALPVIP